MQFFKKKYLCFYFLFISLSLLISSCSSFKNSLKIQKSDQFRYKENSTKDYISQLLSFKDTFLNNSTIHFMKLNKRDQHYLRTVYAKIIRSNELLFKKKLKPTFYVINDQRPFYFSLPDGSFFFSWGLIANYFKHESLLVSVITYEIVRIHYNLYYRSVYYPLGHLDIVDMLHISRAPLALKLKINKIVFNAMRRAEYDSFAYLYWLQMMNKNILDFSMQVENVQSVLKEELYFKNFMVKENVYDKNYQQESKNSSKEFLDFFKNIKSRSYEVRKV